MNKIEIKIDQEYEKRHVEEIILLALVLDRIYHAHITKIWQRVWSFLPADTGIPFNIESRPVVLKLLNGMTDDMITEIEQTVSRQIRNSWTLANMKNDAVIRAMFENVGRKIPPQLKEKLFPGNERALNAFLNRSSDGMNLSKRIWNLKSQVLTEFEAGLQLSIAEGKSAGQMATLMKVYLKDPDKLFRRVKDNYGKLVLSKAARNHHPGQGKYRSSYKNALRLARNENNMAYRTADYERWKEQEFVLGIEIRLSNRHVIEDICNAAVGRYPANFKFRGFHVSCLCHAIPIRADEKQFNDYIDSMITGNDYEFTGHVQDVPANLKRWYAENMESLSSWKSPPYWITDNARFLDSNHP